MITEAMLHALRERVTTHTHVNEQPENWCEAGRPCVWEVCQQHEDYTALFDKGYGMTSLFKDGMLIDVSYSGICYAEGCIFLSPSQYGEHSGIYKQVV